MKVVVFLVAVALIVPTYGISLLAWLVFVFLSSKGGLASNEIVDEGRNIVNRFGLDNAKSATSFLTSIFQMINHFWEFIRKRSKIFGGNNFQFHFQ